MPSVQDAACSPHLSTVAPSIGSQNGQSKLQSIATIICHSVFIRLCREALLSVAQTFFENEDLGNESVKVFLYSNTIFFTVIIGVIGAAG